MRLAAFVVAVTIFAPAAGTADAIGLALFDVTEDGAQRVVRSDANGKVYCSRYKRCNGDGCTPVDTTTIQYADSSSQFLVSVAFADPTEAGAVLMARADGITPTAGYANVTVRTTSTTVWSLEAKGTVEVIENQYGTSPFRAVVTLTGITDGTRMIEGSIECPDMFVATGGGGGCGGGGGGRGGGPDLDD